MENYIELYKPLSMASFFKKKSDSQLLQPQISSTSSNANEDTEPVETNFPSSLKENFLKEKDLACLKLFIENIKINKGFLTQDILNDKPLIDILINLSCR